MATRWPAPLRASRHDPLPPLGHWREPRLAAAWRRSAASSPRPLQSSIALFNVSAILARASAAASAEFAEFDFAARRGPQKRPLARAAQPSDGVPRQKGEIVVDVGFWRAALRARSPVHAVPGHDVLLTLAHATNGLSMLALPSQWF